MLRFCIKPTGLGDQEILELTKLLKMDSHHTSSVVRQFRMLKDGYEPEDDSEFVELNQRLTVLLSFRAECERGSSCMNLTHTPLRSSLDISTIRELLFVKLNGPPLEQFKAERYATLWLKEGRNSADDKASGRQPSNDSKLQHHQKLFI